MKSRRRLTVSTISVNLSTLSYSRPADSAFHLNSSKSQISSVLNFTDFTFSTAFNYKNLMLEAFLNSLGCVLTMSLLAGAGYYTASRGWYDQNSQQLIARLVTFLSLPCYLFASVSERLTHDELLSLASAMIIPFASIWHRLLHEPRCCTHLPDRKSSFRCFFLGLHRFEQHVHRPAGFHCPFW